ncbi:MAG: transposase [Prevotellaceae bacterium]|jgi:REP element-mobilizing transposase RayT|nr:transposase [Prevotellaceae bacterium]
MKVEYHNIYMHYVLVTQNRMPIILEKFRERIEKYITGIVNNNACKLYKIYANPEHVHILLSRAPQIDDETLITIIANGSEKFINDNRLCVGLFQWQQSCAAFSISKRSISAMCDYIAGQKEHHVKESYEEEHKKLLNIYQKKSGNQVE